ncbi:uncharacterized protein LOC102784057 [Neolamprologus brichardi]|uniref:uncharacterized protein LOC102784057 n=1 Tax=Neolamprologus brichardi TaxID=32507 RepID=UPI001643D22C|nr:uncharacterized protein LOC102784057 [Neolamprologus brichardi]
MACSQAAVGPPLDLCSCSAGGGGASAAHRSRRGGSGRRSAAVMKTVRSCLRTRPYCGGQYVWFSVDRSGNVLEARSWDADWLPGTLHNQRTQRVLQGSAGNSENWSRNRLFPGIPHCDHTHLACLLCRVLHLCFKRFLCADVQTVTLLRVLGTALNNAGGGINIVILNGKTGEVLKTDHYNMYSGDVKPFIELLKSIETGSIVIMASYDEPSTKLNDELKNLIAELGSSRIHSLGYRDNWVFVGGKGVTGKSSFEKHRKSDSATNKYDGWPEMIGLEGCVPKYLE